jgi:hypothetical protein
MAWQWFRWCCEYASAVCGGLLDVKQQAASHHTPVSLPQATYHRLDVSRAGNVRCIIHAACLLEDACRNSGANLGYIFAHVPRSSRAKYPKLVLTPYRRVASAVLVVLSRADRATTTTKTTTAAVAMTEAMMLSSLGPISNTTHKTIIVRLVLSSPTPWS